VLAAPAPNFLSELRAAGLRCLVDHAAGRVVRAAPMLDGRLDVLRQGFRAGVKLPRPPSASGSGRCDPQARVAAFAQPAEILRSIVALISVSVVHY